MNSPAPNWRELPLWAFGRLDARPIQADAPNLPLGLSVPDPTRPDTVRLTIRQRGDVEGVCVLAVEADHGPGWTPAPRWWASAAVVWLHVASRDGDPKESVGCVDATFGVAWPPRPAIYAPEPMPGPDPLPGEGPRLASIEVAACTELIVLALVALRPRPAIDAMPLSASATIDAPGPLWRGERLWRTLAERLEADAGARLVTHRVPGPPMPTPQRPAAGADTDTHAPAVFYLAACLYPAGLIEVSRRPSPLKGQTANAHGPGDLSLLRMTQAKQVCGDDGRIPLVLAGDQVYVDATAGVFDPATLDAPRQAAYRTRFENPRVQRLTVDGFVPVALMDDHEVVDNWEPGLDERRTRVRRDLLRDARDDFIREQRRGVRFPPSSDPTAPKWRTWRVDAAGDFDADFGEHLLIVGDTRSERAARDARAALYGREALAPSILGGDALTPSRQWSAWKEALRRHADGRPQAWRVVATPAMVLPRPIEVAQEKDFDAAADGAALRSDGWSGYPGSLRRLLAFLCDGVEADADDGSAARPIANCLFVSGDAHVGCVAVAEVERLDVSTATWGAPVRLWSVHAPALYAPFPFANGRAEDFAAADVFRFEHPSDAERPAAIPRRRYRCRVRAWFPRPGDGFVRIVLPPQPGGIAPPRVEFHRADGGSPSVWRPVDPSVSD